MLPSALSRLCMMATGTFRSAASVARPLSRCRPQTSLSMAAPWSSAQAPVEAFTVSIDTGTPKATILPKIGFSRASSSSAETGAMPP